MNEQYGLAPSSFSFFCCSYLRFAVDDVVSEVLDSCHGAESSDYDNERWRRLVRHRSLSLSSLSLFFSRYSSPTILLSHSLSLVSKPPLAKMLQFSSSSSSSSSSFFLSFKKPVFREEKREREKREREKRERERAATMASGGDDKEALVSRLSAELLESEQIREQLKREGQITREQLVGMRRENTTLARSREELAMQLKQAREALEERERYEEEFGGGGGADVAETSKRNEELQFEVEALREQVRVLQNMEYPLASSTKEEGDPEENKALRETAKRHEQNNRILLSELEAQEFEIERLFKENGHLQIQVDEMRESSQSWKEQCEDLSLQNERLQEMLQESASWSFERNARGEGDEEGTSEEEVKVLKDQLLQFERLYREEQALNAKMDNEVRHLETKRLALTEEKNDMQNSFIPILWTIEDKLLKLQFQKNKSISLEL